MIPKGNKNQFLYDGDSVYLLAARKDEEIKIQIDPEDVERIKSYDYTFSCIKKDNSLYVCTSEYPYENKKKARRVYLHRWLLGYTGEDFVDHINGNPLDNRKSNLRVVKPYQNSQNRKASKTNNSSGVRGVYREHGKWRARVMIRGKRLSLGIYDTVSEAKAAVDHELTKFWDNEVI